MTTDQTTTSKKSFTKPGARPGTGRLGSVTRSLMLAGLVVAGSLAATSASFADVRDVNRTAGDTVDTVMWPAPPKKESKPKPELVCGVIFHVLLCWPKA